MKYLLKYNARHTLYFDRESWLPKLNPYMSSNRTRDGRRTWSFTEPMWLYRLRQAAFCFAGWGTCNGFQSTWDWGPDGNRTCSHCGSIHPDDLMKICRKTLDDPGYGVEGTTKGYKFYVKQPNVKNAGEGAIKFYTNHVPDNVTKEDQELFKKAVQVTHKRFMEMLTNMGKYKEAP